VIKFTITSRHFYGGGLREAEKPQPRQPVSVPKFERATSQTRSANHSIAMLDAIVRYVEDVLSVKTMFYHSRPCSFT
jgi:hypothetical protein